MPSDAYTVADFPWIGSFTDRVDHARDLMPRRSRIGDSGHDAFLGYDVAMTDAAGLNFDSHGAADRLGHRLFGQAEISASAIHTHYFHRQPLPSVASH